MHTKEPWHKGFANTIRALDTGVEYRVRHLCAPGSGRVIGFIINEEDVDRVIACVNACQRIETSLLEEFPGGINGLSNIAIAKQRDELQRELNSTNGAVQRANDRWYAAGEDRKRVERQRDMLLKAVDLFLAAGFGNSTDFAKQGEAYDAAIEAKAAVSPGLSIARDGSVHKEGCPMLQEPVSGDCNCKEGERV